LGSSWPARHIHPPRDRHRPHAQKKSWPLSSAGGKGPDVDDIFTFARKHPFANRRTKTDRSSLSHRFAPLPLVPADQIGPYRQGSAVHREGAASRLLTVGRVGELLALGWQGHDLASGRNLLRGGRRPLWHRDRIVRSTIVGIRRAALLCGRRHELLPPR